MFILCVPVVFKVPCSEISDQSGFTVHVCLFLLSCLLNIK